MPANNKEQNHIEMGGLTLHPNDRIGSYRYERPIGRGGMADVLLAYDPNGHPMALKVLKASRFKTGLRRFRREFRALAKLKHPNVIQVDSYGDIFGHPYFADCIRSCGDFCRSCRHTFSRFLGISGMKSEGGLGG